MSYDEPDFEGIEDLVQPRRRVVRVVAAVLAVGMLAGSGVLGLFMAITHTGGTPARTVFVSPREDVTLSVPKSWFISDVSASSWIVTSFRPSGLGGETELGDGQIKIDFNIVQAGGTRSIDDLKLCTVQGSVLVTNCAPVSINGRTFGWVSTTQTSDSGVTVNGITVATIANNRIYRADAIVPNGSHRADGLIDVESVLATIVIRAES